MKSQVPADEEVDLSYLLNAREKQQIRYATKYYKKCTGGKDVSRNKNILLYLGDNFKNRKIWSFRSGKIPTLRMSYGKMWSFHLKRWLVGREKLASLGFPVTQETAESMGAPVVPVMDAKRASAIAGNCMAFPTVGVVQMIVLSCLAPQPLTVV